jgi:hypothetical protein
MLLGGLVGPFHSLLCFGMQIRWQHAQRQAEHSQVVFHSFLLRELLKSLVLPHQHFRGDSSSLSDSLCITDSARIYSSGIYADVKTTHVSQSLIPVAMTKSLTGPRLSY